MFAQKLTVKGRAIASRRGTRSTQSLLSDFSTRGTRDENSQTIDHSHYPKNPTNKINKSPEALDESLRGFYMSMSVLLYYYNRTSYKAGKHRVEL
ncbi:hypothetical protein [Ruminococcus albus]|uniref:hypothetical protein n=1 Tax=Ruminococcus albus TaxID=1264 RepID=UPI0009435FA1|nr:hypothetical protein [Ruminococcus albus]